MLTVFSPVALTIAWTFRKKIVLRTVGNFFCKIGKKFNYEKFFKNHI